MKMKTHLIAIFSLFWTIMFSTPQMGDRLILDDDTVEVYAGYGFPLDQYWADPNDYPSDTLFDQSFTGCGRGYVALWELKNDSLFLLKLLKPIDWTELNWDVIFDSKITSPHFASWFNGSLVVRSGAVLKYEHGGRGGLTEFETDYILNNGVLNTKEEYANAIYESEYTLDFQKTLDFLYSNLDNELISKNVEDSLKVIISIYSSESAKIADVKVWRCDNEVIKQELVRIVKLLPDWTAYYKRGKLMRYEWSFQFMLRNEN